MSLAQQFSFYLSINYKMLLYSFKQLKSSLNSMNFQSQLVSCYLCIVHTNLRDFLCLKYFKKKIKRMKR